MKLNFIYNTSWKQFIIFFFFALSYIQRVGSKPQVNLGLSFALVPSKEEYFISTGNYDAPKPTIFKVEPVPYEEMEGHENSKGVLADMGQFVKSSIDKGVQAIKDLVTPESPAEFYATPEPYAYEPKRRFVNPSVGQASRPRPQLGTFVPPSKNQLVPNPPKWKRREEMTTMSSKKPKKPTQGHHHPEKKKPQHQSEIGVQKKKPSLKSTFAPSKNEVERRPIVFFDLTIDDVPAGTVFFELFNETVPKTCENFRVLTTGERGYGYKNSVFHRIVPGYIVQGGDFTTAGKGTGQRSIYGGGQLFEDENFLVPHDSPGMLSMANEGPDSNGSQFFITVTRLNKLDGKHVVFGRIHDETSYSLIEKINRECGLDNGTPTKVVKIVNTGQYK